MKSHNNKKIRYINLFGQPIPTPTFSKKKKKKVDITSPIFIKNFQRKRGLILEKYKVWVRVTDDKRIG